MTIKVLSSDEGRYAVLLDVERRRTLPMVFDPVAGYSGERMAEKFIEEEDIDLRKSSDNHFKVTASEFYLKTRMERSLRMKRAAENAKGDESV